MASTEPSTSIRLSADNDWVENLRPTQTPPNKSTPTPCVSTNSNSSKQPKSNDNPRNNRKRINCPEVFCNNTFAILFSASFVVSLVFFLFAIIFYSSSGMDLLANSNILCMGGTLYYPSYMRVAFLFLLYAYILIPTYYVICGISFRYIKCAIFRIFPLVLILFLSMGIIINLTPIDMLVRDLDNTIYHCETKDSQLVAYPVLFSSTKDLHLVNNSTPFSSTKDIQLVAYPTSSFLINCNSTQSNQICKFLPIANLCQIDLRFSKTQPTRVSDIQGFCYCQLRSLKGLEVCSKYLQEFDMLSLLGSGCSGFAIGLMILNYKGMLVVYKKLASFKESHEPSYQKV